MADQKPWERYAAPAGQGMPANAIMLSPPDPVKAYDVPKAVADLDRSQVATATDRAQLPYAAPKAAADANRAEIDAQAAAVALAEAKRKLSKPDPVTSDQQTLLVRNATLNSVVGQINRVQQLYQKGPGATKGIQSLWDYSPSPQNRQFDSAAAGLGEQGMAAFRVPGQGTQSDSDAARFVAANQPSAATYDIANEERLRQLRGRVDANRLAAGLPAAKWEGVGSETAATGATRTERDDKTSALIDTLVRRGAGLDEINAALAPLGMQPVVPEQFAAVQKYLAANPGYKGGFGEATKTIPNSLLNRASSSGPAVGFVGALNGASGGLLDEGVGAIDSAVTGKPMDQAIADANQARQAGAGAHPFWSIGGNVAGVAGAMLAGGAGAGRLGLTAALGRGAPVAGDVAFGALSGAGENNDNRLLGAGVGAGASLVGRGMFGGATRIAGRAMRGVQNADVRALAGRGVPLTVGQAVGGAAKRIEDNLTGLPLVGDAIRRRRIDGFEGFNRAAFDEGLDPINATTGGVTAEAGVDLARTARSAEYSRVLDPVTLTPDAQYGAQMAAARNASDRLPQDMSERGRFALDRVAENVDPTTMQLSGRGFQQGIRRLRRTNSQNAHLPNGDDLGDVTRQGEDALSGLLERQSPGSHADYLEANVANRNVEVLRDAVTRARVGTRVGEPGLFAPSQLADAASANAKKFGGTHGTTNQPFFELTRQGQRVLPSSVPDSGSASRLAITGALTGVGGLGAGAGAYAGDADTGARTGLGALAAGGALALGGNRTAQRAMVAALLERSPLFQRLGTQLVDQAAPRMGMFGRSLGSSLSPYLIGN